MTGFIAPVDINSNATFGTLLLTVNSIVAFVNTQAVSADQTANGSLTSGNVFVNGVFAATRLSANTLRGGNNTSNSTLVIGGEVFSNTGNVGIRVLAANTIRGGNNGTVSTLAVEGNVNFDSSTVFVDANANRLGVNTGSPNSALTVVGTSTVSDAISVGANNISNTTANFIGNSTVNSVTTSTELTVANSTTNVVVSSSNIKVGNTTSAVTANSTTVTVGSNVVITTSSMLVGNSTVNNFSNSTVSTVANSTVNTQMTPGGVNIGGATIANTTTVAVGANVIINQSSVLVGNSTVNNFSNSTLTRVANATSSANLSAAGVVTGTTVVNTTAVAAGANAILSTTSLVIGNSTVNTLTNSTIYTVRNAGASANMTPGAFAVGISTVNSTAAAVGANVILTSADILIGNSTVNNFSNSTLTRVANSTASANITPAGLVVGTSTINSTAVAADQGTFTTSVGAGSNAVVNTTAVFVGNSTVNTVANSTAVKIQDAGSNVTVNSTALAVGTTVVNSSTVSAAAVTSPTTISVGANVVLTTTSISVGNSTVNNFSNASLSRAANSTASANITPGGLVVGTSVVNSTVVAAGANVLLTTTDVRIGNTTVNTFANSVLVRVANSTASANITPNSLITGTVVINTLGLGVGSNLSVNAIALQVGNATVNAVVNSTFATFRNGSLSYSHFSPTGVYSEGTDGYWYYGPSGIDGIFSNATVSSTVNVGAYGVRVDDTAGGAANLSFGLLTLSNATACSTLSPATLTIGTQVSITNTNITFGNSINNTAITSTTIRTGNTLIFSNAQPGVITLSRNTGQPAVVINSNTPLQRFIQFNTNNNARWWAGVNNDAESGSDAGSTFQIYSFSDGGVSRNRFEINRADGIITTQNNISVSYATPESNSHLTRRDYVDSKDVWKFIASINFFSVNNVSFALPSGYDGFKFYISNLRPLNVAGEGRVQLQVSLDGVTYLNAASEYIYHSIDTVNTTITVSRVTTGNGFLLTQDMFDGSFTEKSDGIVEIISVGDANNPMRLKSNISGTEETTATEYETRVNGRISTNGYPQLIRFQSRNGANLASGIITLLGLKTL